MKNHLEVSAQNPNSISSENRRTKVYRLPPPNDFGPLKPVAVKVLTIDFPAPAQIRRFYNEFFVSQELDGLPGVRRALKRARGEGHFHTLFLEWIEGKTIKDLFCCADAKKNKEYLDVGFPSPDWEDDADVATPAATATAETVKAPPKMPSGRELDLLDFLLVARDAARVLGSIHSCRIIHRDVSSYNFIVDLNELERRRRELSEGDDDTGDENDDNAGILAAAAAFSGLRPGEVTESNNIAVRNQESGTCGVCARTSSLRASNRPNKRDRSELRRISFSDPFFDESPSHNYVNKLENILFEQRRDSFAMNPRRPKRRRMALGMPKDDDDYLVNVDKGGSCDHDLGGDLATAVAIPEKNIPERREVRGNKCGGDLEGAALHMGPLVTIIDFSISCRAEDAAAKSEMMEYPTEGRRGSTELRGSEQLQTIAAKNAPIIMPPDRKGSASLNPGGVVLQGNLQYISPEQTGRTNRKVVDYRSDLYSLGVVFYEMLVSLFYGLPLLKLEYHGLLP